MAIAYGLLTLDSKSILYLDSDPSTGGGFAAETGSIAVTDAGFLYVKTGAGNTDWDAVPAGVTIEPGLVGRLAIYKENGTTLNDQLPEDGFNLDVSISSHTLVADRTYSIPDVGANASFVMTEGAQTINGAKTFEDDMVINANLTVNGTTTTVNTVDLLVSDKLITLNDNGAADSGGGSGIEIEENNAITGYFKTESGATSDAWLLKATDSQELTLDLAALSAPRELDFQDLSGVVPVQNDATLTAGSIIFADATGKLEQDNSNLFYDDTNDRLGIGTNTPAYDLDVAGSVQMASSGATFYHVADSNYRELQATVQTTDATETTLYSFSTASDSGGFVEVHILGRKTAGAGVGDVGDVNAYTRTVRFQNVGGVLEIKNLQSSYTSEEISQFNALIDVSGTNLRFRVQGAANDTVSWECHAKFLIID